jgi:hypothetical protein
VEGSYRVKQLHLLDPNPVKRADAFMSRNPDEFVPDVSQKESEQWRDKILLALLKTPPQPRPKRERGKSKPIMARKKRVSVGKSAPTA